MPAMPTIPEPTKFADWKKAGARFEDGATTTEVHVVNSQQPGIRHAYGRTSDGLFAFFIELRTQQEEDELRQLHDEWQRQNEAASARLMIASIATHPPDCGTPNTPPCPCRDPLMSQADGSRLA